MYRRARSLRTRHHSCRHGPVNIEAARPPTGSEEEETLPGLSPMRRTRDNNGDEEAGDPPIKCCRTTASVVQSNSCSMDEMEPSAFGGEHFLYVNRYTGMLSARFGHQRHTTYLVLRLSRLARLYVICCTHARTHACMHRFRITESFALRSPGTVVDLVPVSPCETPIIASPRIITGSVTSYRDL